MESYESKSSDKKTFFKGIAVGMLMIVWLYAVVNAGAILYGRYISNELTVSQKMDMIHAILERHFVGELDQASIERGIFMGMLYGVGDRYTSYFSAEEFVRFYEQMTGSYVGIGVGIDPAEGGGIEILVPFRDSPAYEAGILQGDIIVEVDGRDIRTMNHNDAVALVRGEEGTMVNLTIIRGTETLEKDVRRATVEMPSVEYEKLENNIGYIQLLGFEQTTFQQFEEAFESLQEQGMESLIIDVRNNPGGLLDTAVRITNMLVPEGLVTFTEDARGNRRELRSDANQVEIPLVVLINGGSASASEVLAGAVKDHGVGILVGEQSFGKGLVQDIFPLPDGSAIRVTIATYYTPNGISIHGEGLTPSHIVSLDGDTDEDEQLQKAIELLLTGRE